jgi:hypothetical protein
LLKTPIAKEEKRLKNKTVYFTPVMVLLIKIFERIYYSIIYSQGLTFPLRKLENNLTNITVD